MKVKTEVWILKPQNYKYVMVNLFSRPYSGLNLNRPFQKISFESLRNIAQKIAFSNLI